LPGEPRFSDVSRILFPLTRAAVIYLARMPERPAPLWRRFGTFGASAHPKWCGVRLVPEVSIFRLRGKNRAGDPLLCFVLHRMGFLMRPRLHEGPVGSYPAFSTLPRTILGPTRPLSFESLVQPQSGAGRYIFCDTFRHLELSPQIPSLFARHAALWCSDFPLAQQGLHQRPPVTTLLIPQTATEFHSSP
jgi:hypothetical protein